MSCGTRIETRSYEQPVATRTPVDPARRAGDVDRDRASDVLGLAVAQGYLDQEEFDRRTSQVLTARTHGEINSALADLPLADLRRSDPAVQARRAALARRGMWAHASGYLAMVVISVVVWVATALVTGPYYFWPIWVILGGGVGVVAHVLPVRQALRPRALTWRG